MDWIGSILLLSGTLGLAYKKRFAWLLNCAGSLVFLYVFINRPALILLQVVFAVLALVGFLRWKPDEVTYNPSQT